MQEYIDNIISQKKTCVFISPHLDDAVLSAGGLIQTLAKKTKVIVVTVFTESDDEKQTLSAWKFVKDMGYKKPSDLFAERRREDKKVCVYLGATAIHLGYEDALWRKKTSQFSLALGNLIAEFAHIYPTYKFHMTKGKLANADNVTMAKLEHDLEAIVRKEKNAVIFAPIGLGNHVDHILVSKVCQNTFNENLALWSDFPYNHREQREGTPHTGYQKQIFPIDNKKKRELIRYYKTQVPGLFPGSNIPDHKEIFFIKKK